jgi:hypothetical protein
MSARTNYQLFLIASLAFHWTLFTNQRFRASAHFSFLQYASLSGEQSNSVCYVWYEARNQELCT